MPELFDILDWAGLRLVNGPANQTFTNGGYDPITIWNNVIRQGTNITANAADNSLTIGKDGHYEITMAFNADFPQNEELSIYAYVNDVQDTSGFLSMQGGGTGKPIELYWSPIVAMTSGQKIELRATNRDSGSVEVSFINAQFRAQYVGDVT